MTTNDNRDSGASNAEKGFDAAGAVSDSENGINSAPILAQTKVKGKSYPFRKKIKLFFVALIIGFILGAGAILYIQAAPNSDSSLTTDPTVVFNRIKEQNELVTVSQDYTIVDKATKKNKIFDFVELPLTETSFWYRYVGTIKAGVNLNDAEYSCTGETVTITLKDPYIISNTLNDEKTGVLDENASVINPIHVQDVDKFRRQCMKEAKEEVIDGGLIDEARMQAQQDLKIMFNAALGPEYEVVVVWQSEEKESSSKGSGAEE